MRLTEYIDGLEEDDEEQKRQKLAEEKSYEIMEYVDRYKEKRENIKRGAIVKQSSPSIFVGRSQYPNVTTGILSPLDDTRNPLEFSVDEKWYQKGFSIEDSLQHRTNLLDSKKRASVDVDDVWNGFVGVQREIAMADDAVNVELGFEENIEEDVSVDTITSPRGPSVKTGAANLTENPHIPKPLKKTLEDDDWKSKDALFYLYRKGFDVYTLNQVFSAGTLGEKDSRKLVPTRWSITAVDDIIGKHLHKNILNNPTIDKTEVYTNEFMGNKYWVILTPGKWEFELVEMKASGSIWNPNKNQLYLSSAHESFNGRTQYVNETAGAYYASRLGVLEHLDKVGKQAKAIVFREVTDEYWAPVGVWPVRESIRNVFNSESIVSESFSSAFNKLVGFMPASKQQLRQKSVFVSGLQSNLADFSN